MNLFSNLINTVKLEVNGFINTERTHIDFNEHELIRPKTTSGSDSLEISNLSKSNLSDNNSIYTSSSTLIENSINISSDNSPCHNKFQINYSKNNYNNNDENVLNTNNIPKAYNSTGKKISKFDKAKVQFNDPYDCSNNVNQLTNKHKVNYQGEKLVDLSSYSLSSNDHHSYKDIYKDYNDLCDSIEMINNLANSRNSNTSDNSTRRDKLIVNNPTVNSNEPFFSSAGANCYDRNNSNYYSDELTLHNLMDVEHIVNDNDSFHKSAKSLKSQLVSHNNEVEDNFNDNEQDNKRLAILRHRVNDSVDNSDSYTSSFDEESFELCHKSTSLEALNYGSLYAYNSSNDINDAIQPNRFGDRDDSVDNYADIMKPIRSSNSSNECCNDEASSCVNCYCERTVLNDAEVQNYDDESDTLSVVDELNDLSASESDDRNIDYLDNGNNSLNNYRASSTYQDRNCEITNNNDTCKYSHNLTDTNDNISQNQKPQSGTVYINIAKLNINNNKKVQITGIPPPIMFTPKALDRKSTDMQYIDTVARQCNGNNYSDNNYRAEKYLMNNNKTLLYSSNDCSDITEFTSLEHSSFDNGQDFSNVNNVCQSHLISNKFKQNCRCYSSAQGFNKTNNKDVKFILPITQNKLLSIFTFSINNTTVPYYS